MVCPQCGTNNPDFNKFCGECGAELKRVPTEPAASAAWTEPEPPEAAHEQTVISGPSFLGLGTSTVGSSSNVDYLLEDEEPASHRGRNVGIFIMILILAAVGWFEWHEISKTTTLAGIWQDITAARSQPAPVIENHPAPPAPNAATNPPAPSQPQPEGTMAGSDQDHDRNNAAQIPTQPTPDDAAATQNKTTKASASKSANPDSDHTEADATSADSSKAPDDDVKKTQDADTRMAKEEKPAKAERRQPKDDAQVEEAKAKNDPLLVKGENYLYGRGVQRNCQQAMVYFRAAAENNNGPAMTHLGALYASGECVPQDRASAYSWFRRAQGAEPNNPWIGKNMAMLWRDMSPEERASLGR